MSILRTWHLHINGQVQGVGFRPYVFAVAKKMRLKGWVNNGADGVHVEFNCREDPGAVVREIVENAPKQSRINSTAYWQVGDQNFKSFEIRFSEGEGDHSVKVSPDFALCGDCIEDMENTDDRRYEYAFTTCTNCGPRYSIISGLPYDRENTGMHPFEMCPTCEEEYQNPLDRRFYSQTNSCPKCGVHISLFHRGARLRIDERACLLRVVKFLEEGRIVAVKGMGGYLLLCDASNREAIAKLRERKRRPEKPFALMYPDLKAIRRDFNCSDHELEELSSPGSPIVLLSKIRETISCLDEHGIAPHLSRLGVMLPYAPLLYILLKKFGKPVVATSGNVSGSPIVYEDHEAISRLAAFADYVLVHNREIVVPQDDSVVRFAEDQRIVLRRSRGIAPGYFQQLPDDFPSSWLALGAEMKAAFALSTAKQITASQYLGDLSSFDAQIVYVKTLDHLQHVLHFKPKRFFTDLHPNYFVYEYAKELAGFRIPIKHIQHHKAHFGAVMLENDLLNTGEPVMGVIWDGTGYGEDGVIWGSEFFTYSDYEIKRTAHLKSYPLIFGDRMAREPQLSALSLSYFLEETPVEVHDKFSTAELKLYRAFSHPETTSMGRLFDGVASMLGLIDISSFEGQAALYLETLAERFRGSSTAYSFHIESADICIEELLEGILRDSRLGVDKAEIAFRFHFTLVEIIRAVAERMQVKRLAFSGGVFQNGLLTRLINDSMGTDYKLYFHKELSPNDENVAVGQLACGYMEYKLQTQKAEGLNVLAHETSK